MVAFMILLKETGVTQTIKARCCKARKYDIRPFLGTVI